MGSVALGGMAPTARASAVTVDGPEGLQLDTVFTLSDQSLGQLV